MATWMLYGANGYTGKLILAQARKRGHQPILAGRHPQRVLELARSLELPARVFDLKNAAATAKQLDGVDLVLNCAGPFSATAKPMLDGCLAAGAHYLDITGEIDVFEMVHGRDAEIRQRGITAIPGVGFDVVPTDCLAAMLKALLPDGTALTLAFMPRGGGPSPGTAKTMVEGMAQGGRIREHGQLVQVPAGYKVREFAFPSGPAKAVTIPWGDVSTAYYSTQVPNIEVYMGMSERQLAAMKNTLYMKWLVKVPPVMAFLKKRIERHVPGPTAEQRDKGRTELWGEITNDSRQAYTLKMRTPEGYNLTADAAVRAVERLLGGPPRPGALTPSMAFGKDFVKELDGVEVFE